MSERTFSMDIVQADISDKGLRCLESLTNVDQLRTLQHVDASRNRISDLRRVDLLQDLHSLSLYFNEVEDIVALLPLAACHGLRNLDMRLNPVSRSEHFRRRALALIPWLDVLDARPVSQDERVTAQAGHDSALSQALLQVQGLPDSGALVAPFDGEQLVFTVTRSDGSQAVVRLIANPPEPVEKASMRDQGIAGPASSSEHKTNAPFEPRVDLEHADARPLLRTTSASRWNDAASHCVPELPLASPALLSPKPMRASSQLAAGTAFGALGWPALHVRMEREYLSHGQGQDANCIPTAELVLDGAVKEKETSRAGIVLAQISAARARVAVLEMENALLKAKGCAALGREGDAGRQIGADRGGFFSPDSLGGSGHALRATSTVTESRICGEYVLIDAVPPQLSGTGAVSVAEVVPAMEVPQDASSGRRSANVMTSVPAEARIAFARKLELQGQIDPIQTPHVTLAIAAHGPCPSKGPACTATPCTLLPEWRDDVKVAVAAPIRDAEEPLKGSVRVHVSASMQTEEQEHVVAEEETGPVSTTVAAEVATPPICRPPLGQVKVQPIAPMGGNGKALYTSRAGRRGSAAQENWQEKQNGGPTSAPASKQTSKQEQLLAAVRTARSSTPGLDRPTTPPAQPIAASTAQLHDNMAQVGKSEGGGMSGSTLLKSTAVHPLPSQAAACPRRSSRADLFAMDRENELEAKRRGREEISVAPQAPRSPRKAVKAPGFVTAGISNSAVVRGVPVKGPMSPRKMRMRTEPLSRAHAADAAAGRASAAFMVAVAGGVPASLTSHGEAASSSLCSSGAWRRPDLVRERSLLVEGSMEPMDGGERARWTMFAQAQLETLMLLRQAHSRLLSEYDSAKMEVARLRARSEAAEAEALVGGLALHTLAGRGAHTGAVARALGSLASVGMEAMGTLREVADIGCQTQAMQEKATAMDSSVQTDEIVMDDLRPELDRLRAANGRALELANGWRAAFLALQLRYEELSHAALDAERDVPSAKHWEDSLRSSAT